MTDRLHINLIPDIDAPQILTLRRGGRSVAGVSGTVSSVPASLRKLLWERPDLVDSDVELTILLERPLACVVQPQTSEGGAV